MTRNDKTRAHACINNFKATLLLVALLLLTSGTLTAQTSKKISLKLEDAPLSQALNRIEDLSGYKVLFTYDEVQQYRVTVDIQQQPVASAMSQVLRGTPLKHSIKGRFITVYSRQSSADMKDTNERTVTGLVLDAMGEPLQGATVHVVGYSAPKYGTVSGADGRFTCLIPENSLYLEVSFIGFATQQVALSKSADGFYTVRLAENENMLTNVVVTGYSNIRRSDYVGAQQTVKMDDVRKAGFTSVDQMLQGAVPGMTVISSSGQIGSTPQVRVRGTSTLLGNQSPLWVVDGVIQRDVVANYNNENYFRYSTGDQDLRQIAANSISWLNPNDVESITVLKDASATAIYGSAAANGVIVITTKKAQASGRVSANYTGELSVGFRPNYGLYDQMNSQQLMQFSYENYKSGMQYGARPLRLGFVGILQDLHDKLITQDEFNQRYQEMEMMNTDWFSLLFRNSVSHNHAVSISGGNDRISTRASVGIVKTYGEARGNNQTQYTASSNTTLRFNHGITATVLLKGNVREIDGFAYGVNPFDYAYNTARVLPATDANGNYVFHGKYGNTSPATNTNEYNYNILNELANTGNNNQTKTFGATVDLSVPIVKNLRYKGLLSYDVASTATKAWATEHSYFISQIRGYEYGAYGVNSEEEQRSPLPYGGILRTEDTNADNWTFRSDLIYDNLFRKLHRVTLQGGFETRSAKIRANYNTAYGYMPDRGETFSEVPKTYMQGSNATDNSLYDDMLKARQVINRENNYLSGYFLGVYSFNDRYALNLSGRVDASNRFGQDKNKKYQPTWAVGGKWRLANEPYMKQVTWLDMLDLSASFGYQGNAVESVSPFLIARVATYDNYFRQYTSGIKSLPYDDLGWEKTHTLNLEAEASMLGGRLNLNFNYYNKKSDVLGSHDVPYENGMGTSVVEGIQMQNRGYELIVNVVPVRTKDWTWQLSVNTGHAKNEMLHSTIVNTLSDYLNGTAIVNGQPYSTLFSYKYKGVDPEDGTPLFDLGKDTDGSDYTGESVNVITEDALDYLVATGKMQPDFDGGFSTSLKYRNWGLNAQFSMLIGGSGRIPSMYNYNSYSGIPYPEENVSRRTMNRWKQPGDVTDIPSVPGVGRTIMYVPSEYNLQNPYEMYYYSDVNVAKTDMIRCNQVSLTYDFSRQLLRYIGAQNLMLRLSLTNPFFIAFDSKWKGIDPETGSWPARRMLSFSVNATF